MMDMNFNSRKFGMSALFLIALTFILSGVVFSQKNHTPKGLARGLEAINKLGARLPEVAARHGKSAHELRRLFLEDSTLWVDDTEKLLYIDDAIEMNSQNYNDVPTAEIAPFPYSQTFLLHSRPGSSRVIYLDFNGHVTSNTSWNTNYTGGQPINSAPFSLDGDPNTFTELEQEVIQKVWQRVAEDFAPFDVDVTTEDPGDAAIFRTSSSDQLYGTRVVISPTNFTGSSIGGIAYVGVFNYIGTNYKPAFVMTSGLGNNEKNIAEATSHEVGHNLGLSHDGTSTVGYYQGHGSGVEGWAPIMGVGYYRNLTQWSKGEYPDANQTQDDLSIIPNYGLAVLSDDHGNTISNPTILSGNNITASGLIATRTDVDVFQFLTGNGNVVINLNPAALGANLNILAEILDSQGNVVASSNPTGNLSASFNLNLSGGTYYLRVDGTGAGNLTTGFSDYGSIGQYNLTGTLTPLNGQPPVAVASASTTSGTAPLSIQFSSANSSDPDGSIVSYSWNFGDGTGSTDPHPTHQYNTAGVYSAVLTVTDNSGFVDTDSLTITVNQPNQPPNAAANGTPLSGSRPLNVSFSSSGSSDPDGTIVSYLWNFGDGGTSTAANPSHTFTTVGNFTVTLIVADNNGATDSDSLTVSVSEPPPFVNQYATGSSTTSGSVSGSYVNTHSNNGSVQAITEVSSGGKPNSRYSLLQHDWTFNVQPGVAVTLYANAWANVSSDGDNFRLSYSTNGVNFTEMFLISGNSDDPNYQTFSLPANISGTVYIRVEDTNRTSGNSSFDTVYMDELFIRTDNDTNATIPNPPSNLTAGAVDASSINLGWNDNSNDELGFYIERSANGVSGWTRIATVGSVNNFTDTGLNTNTVYYYRVQAYNTAGESGFSNTANAQTLSGPPSMHVGDLDSSVSGNNKNWTATISIKVVDANSNPVANATVTGSWSSTGSSSCTTNASGVCNVSRNSKNNVNSVSFNVDSVSHSAYLYDSASNSDPDGDSNGTLITVAKP